MGFLLSTGLALLGLIFVAAIGAVITAHFVYTPPFKGSDGKKLPGSIAEFTRVKIGGISQAVLIRGKSLDNPILLFMHAGPGISMPGYLSLGTSGL